MVWVVRSYVGCCCMVCFAVIVRPCAICVVRLCVCLCLFLFGYLVRVVVALVRVALVCACTWDC